MRHQIAKLRRQKSGNTAVVFALCLLPIFGMVGFAVDLNITLSNKAKAQSIIDSTVLMGARLRVEGTRGNDLRKEMIAIIETQTTSMKSVECLTPKIVDAWWDRTVFAAIECRNATSGFQVMGPDDVEFRVKAIAHY